LSPKRRGLFIGLALLLLAPAALAGGGTSALADVTTSAGEVGRSGWDGAEPGLSTAAVRSGNFQQLYSTALSGQALGQPLVYGSTVIVSTELDLVYGIDSANGALRWTTRLGTPQPVSSVPQLSCGDITPSVGITTTPVIDPASGLLYVTARTWDAAAADPQAATWVLVALSAVDGREAWRVPIQGAASNDPGAVFDPNHQNQRPGLLLMNGWVYAGFGSFCDFDPYRGWVVGVNVTTRTQTLWTDEAGQPGSPRAGVWQTGALASDGPGRILLVSGNGVVPPPGPGTAPPSTLGNAVVRLSVGTSGTLSAVDFFAPSNAQRLAKDDLDLGSAGLAVAPTVFPLPAALSTTHPHLAAIAGKEGKLYLVDRDNLGGEAQGPGGTDAAVAAAGPYPLEHVFTRPAFWPGNGGRIYLVTQPLGGPFGFGTGVLRAFRLDSSGRLVPAGTGRSVAGGARSEVMGFGSGTPMVTSAGTKAGSAVVWMVQRRPTQKTGNGASRLLAFGGVPDARGFLPVLRSFDIGVSAKFSAPTTDQGRVYVATQDGRLLAFGNASRRPTPRQAVPLVGWAAYVFDRYVGIRLFGNFPVRD